MTKSRKNDGIRFENDNGQRQSGDSYLYKEHSNHFFKTHASRGRG